MCVTLYFCLVVYEPCDILCNIWCIFYYSGAYGTVYKARDTINDTIVAIKKVKLGLTEDGVPMQVGRVQKTKIQRFPISISRIFIYQQFFFIICSEKLDPGL